MQRITKQRMAILNCLSKKGRPLTIEEILTYAATESPQINLSTVYRNLKILIEENKIRSIELPGEKACYEIQHKEHRHYFLCDDCNKIYYINSCPKDLLSIVPQGFKLTGHSITLNGICNGCIPH